MRWLKVLGAAATVAVSLVSAGGYAYGWKQATDLRIEMLLDQQKEMDHKLDWLILQKPDGQEFLNKHRKASNDYDTLDRPQRQDDAGSPTGPHY